MKTATVEHASRSSAHVWHSETIGAIAALWMTAAMLAHRLFLGIPSVPGLITERIIPLTSGQTSGDLFNLFGQFAKLIPELAAILAQLLVGALVAGWYAHTWGREDAPIWKRWAFGPLVALGLWLVTLATLWPVLAENYHGQPIATGRALTVLAILGDYLLFGLLLPVLCMLRRGKTTPTEIKADTETYPIARRRALTWLGAGALVAFGAVAFGLRRIATLGYDGTNPRRPVQPITDNASFYTVTKNLADPEIADPAVWRLEISGEVANPLTLTFDDLQRLPAMDETVTLACIGNPLGGGLLSTAVWHGVPLQALLDRAKPADGVTELLFTAADGYTNTIEYDKVAAEGVLVAYGMNGAPLPQRHGYPVRIITPGRYGEKHVKWVTRIEARKTHTKTFYELQGWDRTSVVKTLSRIDSPAQGDTIAPLTPITITGIAFGGLRGVSKVEVTTDGGRIWQPATIVAHPSPQSWSLWKFPWTPPASGAYMLGVRCYEGANTSGTTEGASTGALQPTTAAENFPSGATGIHFVPVTAKQQ